MTIERSYWIGQAACAAPEAAELRAVRAWDIDKVNYHTVASLVCDTCPVRKMCYDDAVEDRLGEGIRAGVLFKIRTEKDVIEQSSVPEYIPMPGV